MDTHYTTDAHTRGYHVHVHSNTRKRLSDWVYAESRIHNSIVLTQDPRLANRLQEYMPCIDLRKLSLDPMDLYKQMCGLDALTFYITSMNKKGQYPYKQEEIFTHLKPFYNRTTHEDSDTEKYTLFDLGLSDHLLPRCTSDFSYTDFVSGQVCFLLPEETSLHLRQQLHLILALIQRDVSNNPSAQILPIIWDIDPWMTLDTQEENHLTTWIREGRKYNQFVTITSYEDQIYTYRNQIVSNILGIIILGDTQNTGARECIQRTHYNVFDHNSDMHISPNINWGPQYFIDDKAITLCDGDQTKLML